jgi:hypothetical protein
MALAESEILHVIGRALDGMSRILTALGDDLGNVRPDLTAPVAVDPDHPLHADIATRGAALLHAFEELAQHFGQLELTRDVLVAGRGGATAAIPRSTG